MTELERVIANAKALAQDAKTTWGGMNEISEWDSLEEICGNCGKIAELGGRAALCVEQAAVDIGAVLTSEEKREAAVQVVDDMIELPGYLEMFDGMVISAIFAFVVGTLNKKFGNLWPKVV